MGLAMTSDFVLSVHSKTAENMFKDGASEDEIKIHLKQVDLNDQEIAVILQNLTINLGNLVASS